MPCSCKQATQWVATRPDNSTMQYKSESQAAADVRRNGGSYRAVGS